MALASSPSMTERSRLQVLWFGPKPNESESLEFKHRDLTLEYPDDTNWEKALPTTRGIVFKYNRDKPGAIKNHLRNVSRDAIDHGALLYAIADDDAAFEFIRQTIERLGLLHFLKLNIVELKTAPPAHEVAQKILLHNPGPAFLSTLQIRGEAVENGSLDQTAQLFLKRAFSDCKSVTISPLPGGRSADVFSVYAEFYVSLVGLWPLPFFAKIDSRSKMDQEWKNYREFVFHFVPFNLRPNLDERRCILGFERGMLVGNFVEHSEILLDVVRRSSAREAIYSLFDHALRGWRLQADPQKTEPWTGFINNKGLFDPSRVPNDRLNLAKTLGATKSPQELLDTILALPLGNYQIVPIHGDLHALNVRVRRTDAILIDFASTRSGPLVADPASLEVSIAFGLYDRDDDNDGWAKLIDTLYSRECIERPPGLAKEPLPREWLRTCVRQIRLLALDAPISKHDYGLALAIYLLRRSMYQADTMVDLQMDEFRKAYGYRVAERIILDIANTLVPPTT